MKTRKLWIRAFFLATIALFVQFSAIARAQDDYDDQSQDPPGRVARLNFAEGSISFRPAGEDDWVTAVPNRPMVTGDDLWADDNSRAEVHLGSAALRLGARTGITFLSLDDHTTQIRLAQGSLILRLRHVDDDDSYEVDTPNLAFLLLQPGEYRLDVSEDGSQTITTVWHGRGRVTGGGFTYTVVAGQSATFNGTQDHLNYDLGQIPQQDDLDSWAFFRDEREDQADSANYVSREMTGYEDLDQYGDWTYVPDYGPCWRPRAVAVGWAPYRYGHWVWVGPWGWTWVEDEPWGFAPFHYGRWAYVNNGWFWVPGPVAVHPVWAPALVGFVGGGPNHRFSTGVGVGWFPLGPGEVYVPSYRVSRGYVNNINVTNTSVSVTHVTNVYNTVIVNKTTINNVTYVNQHVNNGVTVVSRDAFVNARPVAQNVMRVDAREVAMAPVTHAIAAEPVRASVVGAGHPVTGHPPIAVMNRQVVAVHTPPAPPRSIDQRQTEAGGHLNQQSLVRPVAPAQPAPVSNHVQANQGFRPVAQPNNATNTDGNTQVRTMTQSQPRTYEQQGSSGVDEQNGQVRDDRPAPAENREFRSPQEQRQSSAPQQPHPLVRPAPPVQAGNAEHEQQQAQKFNQWQQQRPSSPPAAQKPATRPAEPSKPASPPKKSH